MLHCNLKKVFDTSRNCFFVIIITIATCLSRDFFEQFSITSFSDTSKAIPSAGNEFIIPPTNTTLRQITSVPQTLEKGQVLLRRRFSANEYGLYIGLLNPKAYSKLSAFKPIENLANQEFISRKIYSSQTENPDQDIDNLYFDGDLIYVENIASIFYHDSVWKEIRMLDILPCRLNITSDPPDAPVYINDEYQGTTPLYMGAVYEPTAIIKIDSKGYFIAENFVYLQNGALLEKHYELKKKPVFDDSTEIDIEAYTAENTESVLEINQRIEMIKNTVQQIEKDSSVKLQAFMDIYTHLTPKNQFEKTEEYEKRRIEYEQKKLKECEELGRQFHERKMRVYDILPKIEKYREEIKNREYTKYFDGNLLKLSVYNADSEYFPVTMEVDEKGFSFKFNGKLMIPRDDAKEFFNRGTSSGKIHLTYKNWHINVVRVKQRQEDKQQSIPDTLIEACSDTVRENCYIYFTEFKLRFKDADYQLSGSCNYPSFIEKSSEYANFLKELDDKLEVERIIREARGTIKVLSQPRDAEIFINDSLAGLTPYTADFPPLSYSIKIKLRDYEAIDTTILVEKDKMTQSDFILEHTKTYKDSVEHKILKTKKVWRWVSRIGFGGMTAALAGWGYHQNTLAKDNLKTYREMKSGTAEDFDDAYNSYKKRVNYRNASCIAAALSGAAFVISIPF